MSLLIVRHAHAGSRSAWSGDDRDRPLSEKGRAQAVALVGVLARFGTARLLSSPYVRCMETLGPAATALGLPVEPVGWLTEGAGPEAVGRLADGLPEPDGRPGPGGGADGDAEAIGETWALCTHGDVAIDCFAAFGTRADGIRPTLQKGALWVLDEVDGTLTITDYLQPLVVKD